MICLPPPDLERVASAIATLDASEHHRRSDAETYRLAGWIVEASGGELHDRSGWLVDPVALAVIGWKESRLRPGLVSSCGACGIVQVMQYPGRPTCAEMNADPLVAFRWAANELADIWPQIGRYAAGDAGYRRGWGDGYERDFLDLYAGVR